MEPERTVEVAIVGAGITGLSTAWHLAAVGMTVAVLERSGINAGASGVQPGGVRQQWATRLSCEMTREAAAFYRDFGDRLGIADAPTLEQCGYVFLAESEPELDALRDSVALQNSCGVPSRMVTAAEAEELVPGLAANGIHGASWCAEDGYFDRPQAVVELFGQAAKRAGAEIRIADVVALEQGSGAWTLRLADSMSLEAESVVLAGGYDTPLLASSLGLELPIRKEGRYLFLSDPIRERILEPLVVAPTRQLAAKQLADGRVLASKLDARENLEANEARWRRSLSADLLSLLPILEFVSFPIVAEGFYDVTPDHQPVVGSVDGLDALWIAAGFSGHGFMLAPIVSDHLARAIRGEPFHPWLNALALTRFDGAAPQPELQIL